MGLQCVKCKGEDMRFSTVRALVGWAFQMTEAVPVKVQRFGSEEGKAFDELSPMERKNMAVDIMAKVGRLPEREQIVIAAYFTADIRAINKAAALLPLGWTLPLRRELARSWVNDEQLERSQEAMGECYYLSQQTMSRRKTDSFRELSRLFNQGLSVIEVQVLDLLQHTNHFNTKRSKAFHQKTCIAA
jgi:hypothetical protein